MSSSGKLFSREKKNEYRVILTCENRERSRDLFTFLLTFLLGVLLSAVDIPLDLGYGYWSWCLDLLSEGINKKHDLWTHCNDWLWHVRDDRHGIGLCK